MGRINGPRGGGGGDGQGLILICMGVSLELGNGDATVGVPKVGARHPRQRILEGGEDVQHGIG